MASSTFLTDCCIENKTSLKNQSIEEYEDIGKVVNTLSLVFCSLSLLGVLLLVWPREDGKSEVFQSKNRILVGPNLNSIIKCILVVNILGVIGLLIRSAAWLDKAFPNFVTSTMDANHYFCLVINMWIMYFFTCNHFWHLVYGMEAFMVSNNKELSTSMKAFIGMIAPALVTIAASTTVYYTGFSRCFDISSLHRILVFALFLCPVLIVYIFNPVIFYQAGKSAKKALIWHYGRYTASERKLVDAIHTKFILIMTAYIACWLPNIVNAILISVDTFPGLELPNNESILALFVLMSVMNPLQSVLAALVFWGLPNSNKFKFNFFTSSGTHERFSSSSIINRSGLSARSTGSESEPLISFRRKNTS